SGRRGCGRRRWPSGALRNRLLDGVANENEAAPRAGHGSLDEEDLALGVRLDDLEVQGGHPLVAHAPGHSGALEDPGRRRTGPDGPGGPMHLVDTMAGAEPGEVVALHDAREAFALADGGDVDELARRQHVRLQLLA